MSGKAIIPIAAAGVAAYFLMDSFTKKKTKPAKKKEEPNSTVNSGVVGDWAWKVMTGSAAPDGFGKAGGSKFMYYWSVKEPETTEWKAPPQSGVDTAEKARLLALEFIAPY